MDDGKKVKISVNFDMDFFVEFEKEDLVGINWENWVKELKNNDSKNEQRKRCNEILKNKIDVNLFIEQFVHS